MVSKVASVGIVCALLFQGAAAAGQYFGGQDNQAYLDWVANLNYPTSMYLPSVADPKEGAAVHWRISHDEQYLELGLAVRATGWMGFGLSENGGMTGSDMLLFEAKDPLVVTDAHVLETRTTPKIDDCQDWQLVSSSTDTDFLMIEVRRKLVTGDNQDLPIQNDASMNVPVHRVIAAWGNGEKVGYHGKQTARGAVRWFSETGNEDAMFQAKMDAQASGSFFGGASSYPIKAQDTEYALFCVSASDLVAQGVPLDEQLTLIGFKPIIDNAEHVHHYIVNAGYKDNDDIDCREERVFDIIYPWAPGEPPLTLPDEAGFALGGTNGYRSFQIEIHYDNPGLKEGAIDSSGVEFYYSKEPRQYYAGFLIIGDPMVALQGQSIQRGLTDYTFDCPSNCSTMALDEPVTVVREYIHMHQSGASAYNEHIRNGEVIRTGRTQFFDFRQQGGQAVMQAPFEIQPGDSFRTRCFYRNDEEGRKFGLASSDEMCQTFILYYPAKAFESGFPWMCGVGLGQMGLTACDATWEGEVVTDEASLDRVFGTPSTQCSLIGDSTSGGVGSVALYVVNMLLLAVAVAAAAVV